MNLDAAVRAVLRDSPLTLRTLADRAGVSGSLLSLIAAGKRGVSPATARAIAKALAEHSAETAAAAARIRKALPPPR